MQEHELERELEHELETEQETELKAESELSDSDRARISYVDVVMSFGVIVALIGVAPWLWNVIQSLQSAVDPLTGTLLALFIPMLFLALILSIGVSARSQ